MKASFFNRVESIIKAHVLVHPKNLWWKLKFIHKHFFSFFFPLQLSGQCRMKKIVRVAKLNNRKNWIVAKQILRQNPIMHTRKLYHHFFCVLEEKILLYTMQPRPDLFQLNDLQCSYAFINLFMIRVCVCSGKNDWNFP
jgi:hypothetical protein